MATRRMGKILLSGAFFALALGIGGMKIADVGLVLTPYHPAEYPPINLVGESSMLLRLIEGTGNGKEGLPATYGM